VLVSLLCVVVVVVVASVVLAQLKNEAARNSVLQQLESVLLANSFAADSNAQTNASQVLMRAIGQLATTAGGASLRSLLTDKFVSDGGHGKNPVFPVNMWSLVRALSCVRRVGHSCATIAASSLACLGCCGCGGGGRGYWWWYLTTCPRCWVLSYRVLFPGLPGCEGPTKAWGVACHELHQGGTNLAGERTWCIDGFWFASPPLPSPPPSRRLMCGGFLLTGHTLQPPVPALETSG